MDLTADDRLFVQSPVGAEIILDGRRYTNFAGSSYLGMSSNSEVLETGIAAVREYGAGYQISRHFRIDTRPHQEVEREAASFFKSESALYISAGYLLGFTLLAALRDQFGAIFFDETAHFCLREAIAASALTHYPYHHLDPDDLASKLRLHLRSGSRPLVVTDGVYSTLGEIAPLDALARVIAPYDGRLLVDESHSFGVLGPCGLGAVEHHDMPRSLAIVGGSLSKGFGTSGAIILGTEAEVAAYRRTPAVLGASPGSPAAAAMSARSLQYVRQHPNLLSRLRENVSYLKAGLRGIGLDVGATNVPLAVFGLDSSNAMEQLQKRLKEQGIFVLYSTYIGAPSAGVIRCGIFADHTTDHMNGLIDALKRLL